jgi:hypothetical protein
MKLQIDEDMWNGFDIYYFYFRQDYQDYQEFFSPAARGLSAEGRIIQMILLILPAPCNLFLLLLHWGPIFFKIGIHSSFSLKN